MERDLLAASIAAVEKRLDQRLDASERAIAAAMIASEKAILKAETASEKRFEAVNEFRGLVNDLVARLLPRAEADARFKAIEDKMDAALARIDQAGGYGAGRQSSWSMLVGAVVMAGVAAGLVTALLG